MRSAVSERLSDLSAVAERLADLIDADVKETALPGLVLCRIGIAADAAASQLAALLDVLKATTDGKTPPGPA